MPGIEEQAQEPYKDEIKSIISYTDPYSKKNFYMVKGSEKNIKDPRTFLVDIDDSGNPILGTYEKPEGKNLWDMDYVQQPVRSYTDKPSKVFHVSKNMEQLSIGANPYQKRRYLQDYSDDVFTNANLNEMLRSKINQYAVAKAQQESGEQYINRLKNGQP